MITLGNGKCECGRCICDLGWEGDSCNCNTRNSTCISPESDQVCSGFGTCNCGVCQCKPGNTGKFCEICYTCPNERYFIVILNFILNSHY